MLEGRKRQDDRGGDKRSAGHTTFWISSNNNILQELGSGRDGLTSSEAADRLTRYGPNLSIIYQHRGLLVKLGKRLVEPLIAILLIAALISGATGDWRSFIVIVLIVSLSIALDVFQEQKAESSVEALSRSVAITASTLRDGKRVELSVKDLVPGDIVELRAGDLVPADGIVLSSRGALVNQALLTGEPYPAEKNIGPCSAESPNDAFNALFSGTTLVGGEAKMVVVATGGATRFGAIAASIQQNVTPTAFERGIHALGMLILRLTGFLVLFVLLTQLINHGLSIESFLFAVALAVGLTPELLPMVMTVTLSRGAVRMAEQKVIVKRLSAIHDLGAMNILCTDKTGTLTEARIVHVGSFGADSTDSARVTDLARLNSRFASGMRNNLDDAILAGNQQTSDGLVCLDDLPFDFERRRSSVLLLRGNARTMITKGAPEELLARCTQVEAADGSIFPLDDVVRNKINQIFAEKGRQGFRLLGIAWRQIAADRSKIEIGDETSLVFAGCAAFLDPPKASATEAVNRLMQVGIRVKVISGDAEPVVSHLIKTLALPARGLLSGDEMHSMTDAALAARAIQTDVFVRMSPDQKMRVVRCLRQHGYIVGFLGDGINDAPAIHAADVGISVDAGTEVARAAADIILLSSDLGVLAEGVAQGRRTYANIMKYVRMGTSSNFGNMLSMALASLVLPFLPLTPLQILLNNLVYDVSEIGIPFDTADENELARPQTWDMKSVLRFTLIMGPLSSLFDAATFALLRLGFGADEAVFRTAWFVESIATQILVIFVIRTVGPVWKSHPHPVLVATSLGALTSALALALTPLGGALGFVALSPTILFTLAAVSAVYLGVAELLKQVAMRPLVAARASVRAHG